MIKEIIESKQGEAAVMAIDEILCPIYDGDCQDLTEYELNFCYIEELERQINSGGFNSYFYYSYGDYALETIKALEAIASTVFTSILKEAVVVFADNYTAAEEERSELIDDNEDMYNEKWNKLDDRFYKYSEKIHEFLLSYVAQNISGFR